MEECCGDWKDFLVCVGIAVLLGTKLPMLEPTLKSEGFFAYHWLRYKHFGRTLWAEGTKDLITAAILSALTAFGTYVYKREDTIVAVKVGIFSVVGWYEIVALWHYVQTSWHLHRDYETRVLEARETHWKFGAFAIFIIVLLFGVVSFAGWILISPLQTITISSADPGAKEAAIKQLESDVSGLKKEVKDAEGKQHCESTTSITCPASDSALQAVNEDLRRQLEAKQHNFSQQDLENVRNTLMAFKGFKKAITPTSSIPPVQCLIKVTSPEDSADQDMGRTLAQLAHMASDCDIYGPQTGNANPDITTEAMTGAIDKIVIFHAPRGQQGADALFSGLDFVMNVKRSFEMPKDSKANTIWLQVGTGSHFRN